ncbi:MAG: YHS domain-containing protein [Thermoplasmata archaeon]|nr:YHS domain-containing protein [Thermoplasmata archaeon]MCI4355656.1 YHS domain-containing protein [Thermoplasmata archaeon]
MKVRDPVCGMTIDPDRAAAKGTYDGQTVYFCAVGCQKEFERKRAHAPRTPT